LNAQSWYENFVAALNHFSSSIDFRTEPVLCSVTAQGGSFVLVDQYLEPVSRAFSWTENASESVVDDLTAEFGKENFYHITGWEPDRWLAVCKLRQLQMQLEDPDDIRYVASVPDFVYAQLSGDMVTDTTSAQITGLADFKQSQWNSKILDWVKLGHGMLPVIENTVRVLHDNISTQWGRISLATGSHDQYAAMEAAALRKDKNIMLGTGTAWVVNARTSIPVFDDKFYMFHPGRDFHEGCFGNIATLGQIGKDFDILLKQLHVDDKGQLIEIEAAMEKIGPPQEALSKEKIARSADGCASVAASVKRYMEWSASTASFAIEKINIVNDIDNIIMTGGAASSRIWPQVVADICNVEVKAVNFPELTAYGAALHAMSAYDCKIRPVMHKNIPTRAFEPLHSNRYREWYETLQRPALIQSLHSARDMDK